MATCKLCKNEKELIKKSHIIPEFLYQDLYDEKHQLIKFDAIEMAKGNDKTSKLPQGEYEGELLCKECDNEKIGQFETYLGNILNKKKLAVEQKPNCQKITNDEGAEFTRIENIDYKSLKLCLLSILWRASISKRPLFKDVDLGPYEEKIREQIFSETPSKDTDIPIVVMSWTNDKETATDIIAQPTKHKIDGKTFYSFVINGFIILYGITPGAIKKELESFRLQSDNTLSIIHLPKGKGMEFMANYSGAVAEIKSKALK